MDVMEEDKFQSTPPARGATMPLLNGSLVVYISIHAPREGGDAFSPLYVPQRYISIHAPPRGGRR